VSEPKQGMEFGSKSAVHEFNLPKGWLSLRAGTINPGEMQYWYTYGLQHVYNCPALKIVGISYLWVRMVE